MRPNTRRVNLFISITLGSEFFTQWNLNTSLSDSRILICRKAISISPHKRMGLKRDLIRISHSEFCKWGSGFQTFIQRYRIFIRLSWSIIDNSYFNFFCKFSNHNFLELSFLLSYIIYQDYSLHYYVMEDDFLSR